jgi:CheY-like chemotaxis protein
MSTQLLIVEDDPKSLYAFRSVLEDRGFRVIAFPSAETALEALTLPCDAAIIDLRLPDMQGREFAALLREKQPGIRLIFVTAYNHLPELSAQFENSATLVKPIDLQRLIGLL